MSDPTLASLVPTRTRARNAVLVVAGVALLVAAAFSGRVLRPTFGDGGSSVGVAVGGADRTVVVTMQAQTSAWPWATVTGAEAPAGAHVVGTWVVSAPNEDHVELVPMGTGGAHTTWQDLLAPSGVATEANAVPRRASQGEDVTAVVVWQVDDCGALREAAADRSDEMAGTPFLTWRTIVGTTTRSRTYVEYTPEGDLALDALETAGVC